MASVFEIFLRCPSIAGVFLPGAEKIAAIAVGIPLIPYNGKAMLQCGLESLPNAGLQSFRKASLLHVLLPLVDGVRDDDTFDDW